MLGSWGVAMWGWAEGESDRRMRSCCETERRSRSCRDREWHTVIIIIMLVESKWNMWCWIRIGNITPNVSDDTSTEHTQHTNMAYFNKGCWTKLHFFHRKIKYENKRYLFCVCCTAWTLQIECDTGRTRACTGSSPSRVISSRGGAVLPAAANFLLWAHRTNMLPFTFRIYQHCGCGWQVYTACVSYDIIMEGDVNVRFREL